MERVPIKKSLILDKVSLFLVKFALPVDGALRGQSSINGQGLVKWSRDRDRVLLLYSAGLSLISGVRL